MIDCSSLKLPSTINSFLLKSLLFGGYFFVAKRKVTNTHSCTHSSMSLPELHHQLLPQQVPGIITYSIQYHCFYSHCTVWYHLIFNTNTFMHRQTLTVSFLLLWLYASCFRKQFSDPFSCIAPYPIGLCSSLSFHLDTANTYSYILFHVILCKPTIVINALCLGDKCFKMHVFFSRIYKRRWVSLGFKLMCSPGTENIPKTLNAWQMKLKTMALKYCWEELFFNSTFWETS